MEGDIMATAKAEESPMPKIELNVEVNEEQFNQIESVRLDHIDGHETARFYGALLAYGAFKYSQDDSGTPLK